MTIPKNTIGSHVRSVFSRSTPTAIGSAAERAEASAVRAFEREARVARRVRDLELVRRRLGGREVPLRLEARSGEEAASGCVGLRATQEKTSTEPPMAPAAHEAREARSRRRLRSDDVRGERGRDHRRDELRAAARCSFWSELAAVLVRPIEMCSAPW